MTSASNGYEEEEGGRGRTKVGELLLTIELVDEFLDHLAFTLLPHLALGQGGHDGSLGLGGQPFSLHGLALKLSGALLRRE